MNDWAATRKAWAVIEKARIDQLLEVMDALKVPYLYSEEYLKCRVIIANMYETGRRNQEFKEKMVELGLWGEDDIVPPEPNDSAEVRRVAERLQNKGVMRVTAGDYGNFTKHYHARLSSRRATRRKYPIIAPGTVK